MKYVILPSLFFLFYFSTLAQKTYTLKGRISSNSSDVSGATITLPETGKGTLSSTDGTFQLSGLQAGHYLIYISHLDYASYVDTIHITKDTLLTFSLSRNFNQLEEVVVVADKREMISGAVPAAVTTLNQRQIQEYRLWNIQQIATIIPNLSSAHSGDLRNVTSIRGVVNTSYDPSVVTYIDGVSQFSLDTYMPQLFDVERIEVLRGPQGTLYGRNAMGGVIQVLTKKPQNKSEGLVEIGAGNYGQYRSVASLKLPIIKDQLFFSASGLYEGRKGYYTNTFSGKDFDRQHSLSGNYSLRFQPNDRFWAILGYRHAANRNHGAFPLVVGISDAFDKPYQLNQNAVGTMKDNHWNTSLSLHYRTSSGILVTSQTAVQQNQRIYASPIDADFSPLDGISIANDFGGSSNRVSVFTQELRVQSPTGQKVAWTAGTFLFNQDNPTRQATVFGKQAGLLGIPDQEFSLVSSNQGKNQGQAVFGQLTYPLPGQFQLTIGSRVDWERKQLSVSGEYVKAPYPPFVTRTDTMSSAHFFAFSPKLGISRKTGAYGLVYFSFARGYRAGGLTGLSSDPSQIPLVAYEPELNNTIEMGWKTQSQNNRLGLRLSAFYSMIQDIQVPTLVLPDAVTIIRNAGKMDSKGGELEITALWPKGLEIVYNLGVTDARYRSLSLPVSGNMVDFKGNLQVFTPTYTSLLAANYSRLFGRNEAYTLNLRAEWIALGKQYFDLANTLEQEAYGLLNVRVALTAGRTSLAFWGRNLLQKRYVAYGYDFGGVYLGEPRTIGFTLSKRM